MASRAVLCVGVATALVLPTDALGAKTPLVIEDVTSDANALNDQGVIAGSPAPNNNATPVGSQAQFDIKSLTFTSLPKCTGYTATIELMAPPATGHFLYRVQAVTAANPDLFWLQYSSDSAGEVRNRIRSGDGSTYTDLSTPPKVDGNKLTITVLEKEAKAAGETLSKLNLESVGADTRSTIGTYGTRATTAPQWDVVTSDKAFKVC